MVEPQVPLVVEAPLELKSQEMPAPVTLGVTQAEAEQAIDEARLAVAKVKEREYSWRDTDNFLAASEAALAAGDYEKARDLAQLALAQAESALLQSYAEDARHLIAQLQNDYQSDMNATQQMNLQSAASTLQAGNGRAAYELANELMQEMQARRAVAEAAAMAAAQQPEPEPVVTRYTLGKGDTLWSVAAKPEVYGNADMWPLLWKANRGKIARPDAIKAGMELVIDRAASEAAVAAAIKHSVARGAPILGPVDAFDQQYLNR
jgi:nucleoid-associated protein YgaU